MSLHPRTSYHVPAETARVAKACFPKGNPYLRLADALLMPWGLSSMITPLPRCSPRGASPPPPLGA
jgi:hypothetical protein